MKIKDYKMFLEFNLNWFKSKETKDPNSIESICEKYGIENYSINDDGSVDVDGDVDLSGKRLTKLPLKFGKVTGYFYCFNNKLTTLEGSPKSVGRDFVCYTNQLKTLEGGPEISRNYYCQNNQLVNFKGFPEDYNGDVNFMSNPVYELLRIFQEKIGKK